VIATLVGGLAIYALVALALAVWSQPTNLRWSVRK
jgi:hypothetical protein